MTIENHDPRCCYCVACRAALAHRRAHVEPIIERLRRLTELLLPDSRNYYTLRDIANDLERLYASPPATTAAGETAPKQCKQCGKDFKHAPWTRLAWDRPAETAVYYYCSAVCHHLGQP